MGWRVAYIGRELAETGVGEVGEHLPNYDYSGPPSDYENHTIEAVG